jgi:serine phosphatase RsbU (regulator of sigma subunit)
MEINQIISKVVNSGVTRRMSFYEKFVVKNSNRLSLIGFCCPIFLIYFSAEGNYSKPYILVLFLTTISLFLTPYLNGKKQYNFSKYFFFIPAALNIVSAFYKTKQLIGLTIFMCLVSFLGILTAEYIEPWYPLKDYTPIYHANLFFSIVYTLAFSIVINYENDSYIDLVLIKNRQVKSSRLKVAKKNKELLDSINYAKHIQEALLGSKDLIQQNLQDYFVLFKPKSNVSGDFYWATVKNDYFYFALCDSTGHGVPGAFMSLLNISFLNEAVIERGISEPNEIFNHVRSRLLSMMSNYGINDGMDGVIIKLSVKKDDLRITYAGANNSPIIYRDGSFEKLPYDRMNVGKGRRNESFTNYEINLEKGATLYLCTDGYYDQFGGENSKKYMKKRLFQTLNEISLLHMKEQKTELNARFEDWKGELEQIDDVSIVGFKL